MMTNCNQRGVNTKIKRVFQTTASVIFSFMIMIVLIGGLAHVDAYGTTSGGSEAWAIVIGDEEKVYVESEEKGVQVIEGIENYYRTKDSKLIRVTLSPEPLIVQVESPPKGKKVKTVEKAISYLCKGEKVYKTYTVKKGETLTSIAKKKGLSAKALAELNENKYTVKEKIKAGRKIKIYAYNPYVDVKTVEKVTNKEGISYKTVYRSTKNLKYGTSKVKTKGKKGQKVVVRHVTKVNGKKQSSTVISSKRIKDTTTKVVLKGTGNVTAKKGKTFSFRTGADVVKYAKKYVGNPYKYGGTSLTKGADCSGFVYRVYKNLGVNLPRVDQETVGKKVSYKNVKKGDILFYSGHVAIYAGNGKAIHAVNERLGIKITDVNYTGKVLKVRRIFE